MIADYCWRLKHEIEKQNYKRISNKFNFYESAKKKTKNELFKWFFYIYILFNSNLIIEPL